MEESKVLDVIIVVTHEITYSLVQWKEIFLVLMMLHMYHQLSGNFRTNNHLNTFKFTVEYSFLKDGFYIERSRDIYKYMNMCINISQNIVQHLRMQIIS